MTTAAAYLVETIPNDLDLHLADTTRTTADTLITLTNQAQHTIDISAMYWSLLTHPDTPDEANFTPEQLTQLGAAFGRTLYQALISAAKRGVHIRIVQSPGFIKGAQESDELATLYPNHIHTRQIDMTTWYGNGVMHQKLWIFDQKSIYLGSANMDWRALTQVKELGILIEEHPLIAHDATQLFTTLWRFAQLTPTVQTYFDKTIQGTRQLPCWSNHIPEAMRCPNPLPYDHATYNHTKPLATTLNQKVGTLFITTSPPEICAPDRTDDETGLIYTIHDANAFVHISVMDFLPTSLYRSESRVWWPTLINALFDVMVAKQVKVKLLISQWFYSNPLIEPALRALQQTAQVYQAQLAIKRFTMPGWDSVDGPNRQYPGHSRVNHTKYIVTDKRLNIGTSNMSWDYFASTIGASFNSDHHDLVQALQAIFQRDWDSIYATSL